MKRLVLFPEDVTGFTIKDIEDSVQGIAEWDDWGQNIVVMFPYNPTVSSVPALFDAW